MTEILMGWSECFPKPPSHVKLKVSMPKREVYWKASTIEEWLWVQMKTMVNFPWVIEKVECVCFAPSDATFTWLHITFRPKGELEKLVYG